MSKPSKVNLTGVLATIRLRPATKKYLEKQAWGAGIPITTYARYVLEQHEEDNK